MISKHRVGLVSAAAAVVTLGLVLLASCGGPDRIPTAPARPTLSAASVLHSTSGECAGGVIGSGSAGSTSGSASSSSGSTASCDIVITPSFDGALGANGWFTKHVVVTWTVVPAAGVTVTSTSGCGATKLVHETTGVAITCSATGTIGGSTTSGSSSGVPSTTVTGSTTTVVRIDHRDPSITFAGNEKKYTVDATIAITCVAADDISGIAATTCADINAPAYTFPVGKTERTVTATDGAGHTRSKDLTFRVHVTTRSLCALIKQFSTSASAATSLCKSIGSPAFVTRLEAQSGASISADNAIILKSLAVSLANHDGDDDGDSDDKGDKSKKGE